MTSSVKSKHILFLVFINLFALVSCAGRQMETMTVNVNPPVMVTAVSGVVTNTPGINFTSTPLYTETPMPIRTSSPVVVTTPTLGDREGYDDILNLLQTNGNCVLPCIMNISPGTSRWDKVQAMFSFWGKEPPKPKAYDRYKVKAYSYQFAQQGQPTLIGFKFYVQENEITLLTATVRQVADPEIAKQYSLKTVLSTLGPPNEIKLQLTGFGAQGPEDVTPYRIRLFYDNDQYWLIARYEGIALKRGNLLNFCPADLQQGVKGRIEDGFDLFIQPGHHFYTPGDLSQLGIGGDPVLSGRSFEEATNEDLMTFYQRVTEIGEKACFITPTSLW